MLTQLPGSGTILTQLPGSGTDPVSYSVTESRLSLLLCIFRIPAILHLFTVQSQHKGYIREAILKPSAKHLVTAVRRSVNAPCPEMQGQMQRKSRPEIHRLENSRILVYT